MVAPVSCSAKKLLGFEDDLRYLETPLHSDKDDPCVITSLHDFF